MHLPLLAPPPPRLYNLIISTKCILCSFGLSKILGRTGLIITQLYVDPEAGAQFPPFPASVKDQRSLDVDLGQVNLIIASSRLLLNKQYAINEVFITSLYKITLIVNYKNINNDELHSFFYLLETFNGLWSCSHYSTDFR